MHTILWIEKMKWKYKKQWRVTHCRVLKTWYQQRYTNASESLESIDDMFDWFWYLSVSHDQNQSTKKNANCGVFLPTPLTPFKDGGGHICSHVFMAHLLLPRMQSYIHDPHDLEYSVLHGQWCYQLEKIVNNGLACHPSWMG